MRFLLMISYTDVQENFKVSPFVYHFLTVFNQMNADVDFPLYDVKNANASRRWAEKMACIGIVKYTIKSPLLAWVSARATNFNFGDFPKKQN